MSRSRPLLWALGLLPAVWMSTGMFVVETGDLAVVFRLGEINRTAQAGLGLRLPWPLEMHEIVSVSEVRRVEPGRTRMLTGDTNLVDLDLVVQVTVADPAQWLTGTADPEAEAAAIVTAVATDVVATMDVDRLLTTGRTELQQRVLRDSQAILTSLNTGARIDAVNIRELTPPPAVVDAFNDVSSARGDRETLALGAEAYTSKRIPEARGQTATLLSSAHARAAERIAAAQADIARFQAAAASPSPRAEVARLRAAAWSRATQRAHVRVVPAGSVVQLPTQSAGPDSD
ncbi:MAG: hypothetical protein CL927_04940 [Deltaproteobacteria bacterium]|nr:hypothetical protein [Deltaproteobacteria bacterium]HCH64918.1 hypothetical protein [Deltaproteobacteria bacterium]